MEYGCPHEFTTFSCENVRAAVLIQDCHPEVYFQEALVDLKVHHRYQDEQVKWLCKILLVMPQIMDRGNRYWTNCQCCLLFSSKKSHNCRFSVRCSQLKSIILLWFNSCLLMTLMSKNSCCLFRPIFYIPLVWRLLDWSNWNTNGDISKCNRDNDLEAYIRSGRLLLYIHMIRLLYQASIFAERPSWSPSESIKEFGK